LCRKDDRGEAVEVGSIPDRNHAHARFIDERIELVKIACVWIGNQGDVDGTLD
jgi:hypothetical protein